MTGWKRPSLATKFHIDNDWWLAGGKDLRVAVRGQLCKDCQARFPDHRNLEAVDWVDPETAEVVRADALLQALHNDCARKPEFISAGNALVTNIFRIFVTAIAAYAISTSFAEDFLHEISGLLVFVTALILILILGGILRWRKKPS